MKNILIIPNKNKDKTLCITNRVAELFRNNGSDVYVCEQYCEPDTYSEFCKSLPRSLDLIVVVGGDGSILDASRLAIEKKVPILGVNLGKLGYLSEVDLDNIDILSQLYSGEYIIEEKMLLEVELISAGSVKKCERMAVNDIIIGHDTFLGIADFRLQKSDGETVKYRADGIIFSTPVGSTAYSLSAGGPILAHDINSIVVTPIAPHSFFNRSIIFNSNEKLKVKNDSSSELKISVDGRFFDTVNEGEECLISTSPKTFKILTFNENNTFSTLFKKMRILEDIK